MHSEMHKSEIKGIDRAARIGWLIWREKEETYMYVMYTACTHTGSRIYRPCL